MQRVRILSLHCAKKTALPAVRLCLFLVYRDCAATAASPLVRSSPSCIRHTEALGLEWAISERQNICAR